MKNEPDWPKKRDVSGYTEGHGYGSHSHAIDCGYNDGRAFTIAAFNEWRKEQEKEGKT